MTDTPHFAFPFAFSGPKHSAAVVEQDSREEVEACVQAILSVERGAFLSIGDFGIPEQALREGGADLATISRAIALWEPRARALVEREPGLLETLIDTIRVKLTEATSG